MISVNNIIFPHHEVLGHYRLAELLAQKYLPLTSAFPVINVVGTNGKGSVATYLAQQLQTHHHKVGLFTSPAFLYHNERIKINNTNIPDDDLHRILIMINEDINNFHLTFFEIWVLIALIYFTEQQIDLAVIEAGIGGGLDSTRFFVNQKLVLLTSIGWDHMDVLGHSIEKILWNKVTIVKNQTTLLISDQCRKYQKKISEIIPQSQILIANKYLNAPNKFQESNIGLVILSLQYLGLPIDYQKFETVPVLGRFTIMQEQPLILLDGAHNLQGINMLITEAKNRQLTKDNTLVLFAASIHKDYYKMLKILHQYFKNQIVLSSFVHPLSWNPAQLKLPYKHVWWQKWLQVHLHGSKNIIICGSLYFIPQVYLYMINKGRKGNNNVNFIK